MTAVDRQRCKAGAEKNNTEMLRVCWLMHYKVMLRSLYSFEINVNIDISWDSGRGKQQVYSSITVDATLKQLELFHQS